MLVAGCRSFSSTRSPLPESAEEWKEEGQPRSDCPRTRSSSSSRKGSSCNGPTAPGVTALTPRPVARKAIQTNIAISADLASLFSSAGTSRPS